MPVKENSEEGDSSEIPDWSSISRLVCRNPTQSPSLKSGENRKVQKDQNLITEYTLAKTASVPKRWLVCTFCNFLLKVGCHCQQLVCLGDFIAFKAIRTRIKPLTQNRVEKSEELSQLRAGVTIDKSCRG